MAASRSKPAGTPGGGGRGTNRAGMQLALKRIAGYAEEPSSDGEGPNPFVLSSSEGEDLEDGVVDRCGGAAACTCSMLEGNARHGLQLSPVLILLYNEISCLLVGELCLPATPAPPTLPS
jgi:hypothetical protein